MSFSHTLTNHLDNISSIVCQIGEQTECHLICDIHPSNVSVVKNDSKIRNLQYLAKNKKYICEIGVNTGHSLSVMLDSNPTAKYLLFDLGAHKYTLPCMEYIKTMYHNTDITIVYGDPIQTIKKYIEMYKKLHFIDLCHIDGDHTTEILSSDLDNAMKLCCSKSIIVIDDAGDSPMSIVKERLKGNQLVAYDDEHILSTRLHTICQKTTASDTFEYIGKIFYINLDRRSDRKKQICRELNKMNIPQEKYERYSAHLTNPGTYGCGVSHINVLQTALERGYKNVLVLEDDFLFKIDRPTLDYYLEYFFQNFNEPWDVVMLTYALDKTEEYKNDSIIGRVRESHNAAGYIVNGHYLQTLIDTLKEGNRNLIMTDVHWLFANDVYWINLQQIDRWFYFKTEFGYQSTTDGDTGFCPGT